MKMEHHCRSYDSDSNRKLADFGHLEPTRNLIA